MVGLDSLRQLETRLRQLETAVEKLAETGVWCPGPDKNPLFLLAFSTFLKKITYKITYKSNSVNIRFTLDFTNLTALS